MKTGGLYYSVLERKIPWRPEEVDRTAYFGVACTFADLYDMITGDNEIPLPIVN